MRFVLCEIQFTSFNYQVPTNKCFGTLRIWDNTSSSSCIIRAGMSSAFMSMSLLALLMCSRKTSGMLPFVYFLPEKKYIYIDHRAPESIWPPPPLPPQYLGHRRSDWWEILHGQQCTCKEMLLWCLFFTKITHLLLYYNSCKLNSYFNTFNNISLNKANAKRCLACILGPISRSGGEFWVLVVYSLAIMESQGKSVFLLTCCLWPTFELDMFYRTI